MVNGVVRQLENCGETEVESSRIGELAIEGLRSLDPVAFVRFASVYRDFREVKDFNALVDELVGKANDLRESAVSPIEVMDEPSSDETGERA